MGAAHPQCRQQLFPGNRQSVCKIRPSSSIQPMRQRTLTGRGLILTTTRQPYARWYWTAAAMGLVMCSAPPSPPRTQAPDSSAIARDSVAAALDHDYQAQLAKYRRAEGVIDSVARVARQDPIIRTDSLYRVYRWALRPQGVSVADANVLSCLETALVIRYGIAASDRVVGELRDTVFRDQGTKDAVAFYWSRAPSQGRLDSGNCMREQNPHPDEIDGTPLDRQPSPPHLRSAS